MKKTVFCLFSLFTALVLVFAACSDNATEPELTEGDYQDTNYQTARYFTELIVDSLFMSADAASDFIGFDGSAPMSPAAESLLITFDEETCWWHIYFGADTTDASMIFVDSVKFQDAEHCHFYLHSQ